MPNHVRNVVKFKQLDDGKTVDELLQEIHGEKENQYISFDKIIPMAEELNINAYTVMDLSTDIYRWKNGETLTAYELAHIHICANDDNNTLTDEEAAEKCISSGLANMKIAEQAVDNKKKYGYSSWYDWRKANWGTKWDAYDQSKVDENTIAFNTAWSDPTPIIEKLVKDNPNMRIDHKYADESPNFVGHTVYERGEKVYDQIYYYEEDNDKIEELYKYCWSDIIEFD